MRWLWQKGTNDCGPLHNFLPWKREKKHVNSWIREVVNSETCEFVTLRTRVSCMYDLSSAFDLAEHKILISKLKVYGFDSIDTLTFWSIVHFDLKSMSWINIEGFSICTIISPEIKTCGFISLFLVGTQIMCCMLFGQSSIKEILCHKMRNCFKNIGSVIYLGMQITG